MGEKQIPQNSSSRTPGRIAVSVTTAKQKRIAAIQEKLGTNVVVPDGFKLDWEGVHSLDPESPITYAPFVVSHQVADPDGTGRTLFISGLNTEGQKVTMEIPFIVVHANPASLASTLSSNGIRVECGAGRELAKYINSFVELPIRTRVSQPGWVGNQGNGLAFALPDRVIGGSGYDLSRLASNPQLAGFKSEGTLEEWIKNVAIPAGNHPVVAFSLMTAFASPLLRLLNEEGFGALLRAQSSKGKTTSLLVMASVFGRAVSGTGADDGSLILTFNGTANAIEASCAARNDIGLALDEVGMFDGQDFSTMAYRLAGGESKSRLGRDSSPRSTTSWRFTYLCSGERSVQEVLAEDRRSGRVRAGQMVRLMNIETEDKIIIADNDEDAAAAARALRDSVSKYYGTAGPTFVEKLINGLNDPEEVEFTIDSMRTEWEELTQKLTVPGIEAHQQRAIRNLALIALGGSIACMFGILPYKNENVLKFVKQIRDMYLASGSTSDAALAARRLRDYMIDNATRFSDIQSTYRQFHKHAEYYWNVSGRVYYLFTRKSLSAAAGTNDVEALIHYLKKHDLIHQNNGSKKLQSRVPAVRTDADYDIIRRQMSMYCISEHLTGWRDDQPHPTKEALFGARVTPKGPPLVRREFDNN